MAEKTDREWIEFCRPFVFMNGSHEFPNYPAICRAVAALSAPPPAGAQQAVADLDIERLGVPTLESELRFMHEHNPLEGYKGSTLWHRVEAALAAPAAAQGVVADNRCSLCGGRGFYGTPGARCEWCKGTGKSLAAPAAAQREREQEAEWLRELLRRSMGYVKEASTRYYDGTDGASIRASAASLFKKIETALAATPAPEAAPSAKEGEALTDELFDAADEALELTRLHGGPQLPRLFEAVRAIQCSRSGG